MSDEYKPPVWGAEWVEPDPTKNEPKFGVMVERGGEWVTPATRLGEQAAIVRELAERGPFIDEDGGCGDCHRTRSDWDFEFEAIQTPANHEPTCLWRRARALYPQDAGS